MELEGLSDYSDRKKQTCSDKQKHASLEATLHLRRSAIMSPETDISL